MNRVSTIGTFRNAYNNVSNNYYKTVKTNNLISSENKFLSFDDFRQGADLKFMIDLMGANEEADTYIQNIGLVRLKITAIKDAIEDILNIAEDSKNQLWIYQSMKMNLSDDQIQNIIALSLNNIKNSLNSTMGGYYLFSGSKFDTLPVEEIIDETLQEINYDYYKGDNFIPFIKLNQSVEIPYSVNANNSAFAKLINALNVAYYDVGNFSSINKAEVLLESAISDLIAIRYTVLSSYGLLDRYDNYWENLKNNLNDRYVNLEQEYHFSFPELLADLTTTEVILEASQAMFSKITSINLLDSL